MNTKYASKNKKLRQIFNSGEIIFRDTDLAVIWGITNKNTLYTTIKRYAQQYMCNSDGRCHYTSTGNTRDTVNYETLSWYSFC